MNGKITAWKINKALIPAVALWGWTKRTSFKEAAPLGSVYMVRIVLAAGCGFCDLESEHTVRAVCLDLATGFVGLYYSKPCGCLDFVLESVLL